MANATKKTITIDEVILTLTSDEAETLYSLTTLIAGNKDTSRRRHTDAIATALREAGVTLHWPGDEGLATGRVTFEEGK